MGKRQGQPVRGVNHSQEEGHATDGGVAFFISKDARVDELCVRLGILDPQPDESDADGHQQTDEYAKVGRKQ